MQCETCWDTKKVVVDRVNNIMRDCDCTKPFDPEATVHKDLPGGRAAKTVRNSTQHIWMFQDRKTERIYTDCVATSRDDLLDKAVKMYGRDRALWNDHPESAAVCVTILPANITPFDASGNKL